jgi:hypothetical protein
MSAQMDPETIPLPVIVGLYRYRDAMGESLTHFRKICDARLSGDRELLIALEKPREEKRYAIDRARRELDEAVRAWGQR